MDDWMPARRQAGLVDCRLSYWMVLADQLSIHFSLS